VGILVEAGRELAIIHSIPVEGFGWIKRDVSAVTRLEAEQPSNLAFLLENLDRYLSALAGTVLTVREVQTVRDVIQSHFLWLEVEQAHLAHGDFDLTHIYQKDGHYTGIIDFGEIRGTGLYYDLGHFRLHDGEANSYQALPSLLTGYRQVVPLPPDHERRIAFLSLLIGIRFLARDFLKLSAHPLSEHTRLHARASIDRDLELLQPSM
jgi:Ser/Thr protein kinase RdoA (MazF antagonist)